MHIPVLKKEVIEHLDFKKNEKFIDCTAGEGGHLFLVIEKILPEGKALGIDKDARNIEVVREKAREAGVEGNLILVKGNYGNLEQIAKENDFLNSSGALLDLGFSSWHVEESGRGFSFQKDEFLDMRYSDKGVTAWEIVNSWPEREIGEILKIYGEERYWRPITKAIVTKRRKKKINTTGELVAVIEEAVPFKYKKRKIHFATKVFQALRIVVNSELENLGKVLPQIISVLKSGGRMVFISFHSLEDRMIKNFLKEASKEGKIKLISKKPVRAGEEELKNNPKSRSAKLRSAIKV